MIFPLKGLVIILALLVVVLAIPAMLHSNLWLLRYGSNLGSRDSNSVEGKPPAHWASLDSPKHFSTWTKMKPGMPLDIWQLQPSATIPKSFSLVLLLFGWNLFFLSLELVLLGFGVWVVISSLYLTTGAWSATAQLSVLAGYLAGTSWWHLSARMPWENCLPVPQRVLPASRSDSVNIQGKNE